MPCSLGWFAMLSGWLGGLLLLALGTEYLGVLSRREVQNSPLDEVDGWSVVSVDMRFSKEGKGTTCLTAYGLVHNGSTVHDHQICLSPKHALPHCELGTLGTQFLLVV